MTANISSTNQRSFNIQRMEINKNNKVFLSKLGRNTELEKPDQVFISPQAQNLSDTASLRQSMINHGIDNTRRVNIEHGNASWVAIITPDGIWRENYDGTTTKLDTSQGGLPGIPQSTIRELEHLSDMLQRMPTDNTNAVSLHDRLQQMTNAFAEMREEFNNQNQHWNTSEAAFRMMIENSFGLSAQLARINLGNTSAADIDENTAQQMRNDAQQQINAFTETFLNAFRAHGVEEAFNMAWARLE